VLKKVDNVLQSFFFYSIWLHLYFDFLRPVSEYRELVSVCNRRGFTPGIL
jgi:hypothetical protein